MQTELQVSPAGKPTCDRLFCPCPTTCGPESWKQEECDLMGPATRAQPTLGMLMGKETQRRSPHPYSLSQGGEQEVHNRLLLCCIESHRFVIQYTASLCTAHTANPCTIFLSVFPPPPTVLLTSLYTGETEQLRKQPSGGKFLKVF